MTRRVLPLLVGLLLLPLGCGDPTGPAYATLVVATTSLPNAARTTAYSETLTATGGDSTYTWSVTIGSLPTGLSLTTSTGEITGTPSAVGSNTFTVQVGSGDGQTDTQQLTISVLLVLQPNELCSHYPDYAIATFEEANLEARVQGALALGAQVHLTCGLMSEFMGILGASSAAIGSLVGIQNLTSLDWLALDRNSITDIGPLSGLTSLTTLNLNRNSISDISGLTGLRSLDWLVLDRNLFTDITALSGLTSLTNLNLSHNSISGISALSGLTRLTFLDLHNNSITGISALSRLTSLTFLDLHDNSITDITALSGLRGLRLIGLSGNSITDITALSGLTFLRWLELFDNPDLTDIQPLLDNIGLGADDQVFLRNTSVSCTDVAALQAKGVTVDSDCL